MVVVCSGKGKKIGWGGVRFSVTKGFLTYPYVCEMCSLEVMDKKEDCNSTTEAGATGFLSNSCSGIIHALHKNEVFH